MGQRHPEVGVPVGINGELRDVLLLVAEHALDGRGARCRFINDLHRFATVLDRLPVVERSRDPNDNYLLAMAEAGAAEFLFTGDKRDILALKRHGNTAIITAKEMLPLLGISN